MTSLFSFILLAGLVSAKVPDYIHICKRNDPNVDQCLKESTEGLREQLKKGIPELDVPSIEPLHISEVVVARGSDASRFHAKGKNIQVFGPSEFQINKLRADLTKDNRPTFHLDITLPHIQIEGDYEINAKILSLPLIGDGKLHFNATNAKADGILYGQLYKKGTKNYIRFNKLDMALDMDDYSVRVDNLFKGDRILGEAINQLLNDNKDQIGQSLNPTVIRTVSEVILDIGNKIAGRNSYDELFPAS